MKTKIAALFLILACSIQAMAAPSSDPGWPRVKERDGNRMAIYQPQVDEWKNFQDLTWRMAVSITPKGGKEVFGVVKMKGKTFVDNESKVALIEDMEVTGTNFPPEYAEQMSQLVHSFNKGWTTISLHRLIAGLPAPEAVKGVELNNEPPEIFVSYSPSILLNVDGKPVLSEIPKTSLKYVVNTPWPIFADGQNYYLAVDRQWMKAKSLEGEWKPTREIPQDMIKVTQDEQWKSLEAIVPAPKPTGTVIPAVYYSSKPSDIILFDGAPRWTQIPETSLQYAVNTDSVVFLHSATQQFYFLTGGRWFRAANLKGPWTFATLDLPEDFRNIPANCPAASVRPSVPGTDEAKDAVLLAQVPTTITVDPAKAAEGVKVQYAGDPKFEPITGTPLTYAVNTPDKVIKVGDVYYLCLQGVWFLSPNPNGPWTTASSVPREIYTIPPSSPVYNVTYVTQTTTSSGAVESSYTAGYLGAFILDAITGAIIADGSGYWNEPYCSVSYTYIGGHYHHPVYYPRPVPYGRPYYGVAHYNTTTGAFGVSRTVYGPYGSATRAVGYNPYTGTYARGGSVATPYGRRTVAQAYNPYTGTYAATRQGSSPTAQWGSSYITNGDRSLHTQHYSNANGTVARAQGSEGGKAVFRNSAFGTSAGVKTADGDVYAGRNGNVYKNTGDGWQKYEDGEWNSMEKPSPKPTPNPPKPDRPSRPERNRPGQPSQLPASQPRQLPATQPRDFNRPDRNSSPEIQGLQREAQNRQRGGREASQFQRGSLGSSNTRDRSSGRTDRDNGRNTGDRRR